MQLHQNTVTNPVTKQLSALMKKTNMLYHVLYYRRATRGGEGGRSPLPFFENQKRVP